MDAPPEPLTSAQYWLLRSIVKARQPELLDLVTDAVNQRWLSDEECDALSDVALAEFLDHLGPDDEPDRVGVAADELVGLLAMQRRGYWID